MADPSTVPATVPRWRVAALITVALLLVAAIGALAWRWATLGTLPSDAEKSRYIAALEATVLPVVTDLQVQYFMDEHGCATLTYKRGDFIDGNPEDCGGSTDDPIPFDDTTRADHAQVAAVLEQSDTPIERTGGTYRAGGLRTAWFTSDYGAPFATSWELIYDPEDAHPKTSSDQVTFTAVPGNDGWWFACCAD